MKKLNKTLSVLLTFVMLFTTFCFFPLDLGAVEADAAVAGIKIVVPETLYLTPSTGASTTIQYYINNNTDGSVKTSQDTSAQVHVTYPGAKLTSISAKTSAAITLPSSITGLVGTTFGSSATTATGTFSLPAGLNAGGTALVEWTFVFDVNGKTQTHYAYSIAYAPWYQPVGAAAKAKGAYHNTFASSILWVSGVHGYSDGDSNSRWYIQTANFIPILGTIKTPGNNNPDTNWIQSGSNGLSPTINYQSVEAGGVNYHARANSISPTANLTVDTSRYNNFNQIPNFSVGFMVTDRENANEGPNWYVSDFTGQTSSYYNGTATGSSEYSGDFNSTGTQFSSGNDSSTGIKYNGTWNKAISGTASFRIKSAVKTKTNKVIDTTAWNNNFVNISVTGANKGTLRANVLNGTSYAKENYTADTWNTYYSALKTAATNLCNPVSATTDTSALTSAEAGLHTTLTLNANGGAIGDGVPNTVAMQVGGGTTSSFDNAAVKDAFFATRTGYTFLGWSTDKNATSVPATVTVGFNDTVYAVWEANKYSVVFDNLFDYSTFAITGSLDIDERTDTGFTVTSTAADGNTGFSSAIPVEPGKTYILKADVQLEAVSGGYDMYVHTLNSSQAGETTAIPDTTNGAHREGNVYISLTGQTTNTTPYIRFTAGADTAFIKIRFDANAVGNKLTVNNIRVYEEGTVADDVSYEAPIMVTYDQPFGTLPTPTRTGYEFTGWVDESGTPYASTTKVAITETLRLYSTWELGTYTITFDTKGGNAINSISGHYGDAVTKPADPTKTGYLFTGWDKTVPGTIPAEDMTITATWSENSYAVFFDGNNHTGGTVPSQINTTYTNTITLPECTYTKNGYTFVGWNTKQDGSGVTYSAGQSVSKLTDVRDGGVTLYAMWEETPYTITYVYDNGTGETKVIPFSITHTVHALAAPEKVGHTFAGWLVTSAEGNWAPDAVVDEGVTATGMYGNVTFTAQWTANEYTITFDTDGGSAVAPITQDFGTAVTAPADPTKTGYTFAGWENLPSTMPAGGATVKAKWTINEYTVTYELGNGEENIVQKYDYAENITAPADPSKTGYTFDGWSPAVPGTMPAENITIKAQWKINQYTITFDADGGSAVAPITQDFGTTVTEPAAPTKTGYDFVGWSPALPSTMPAENISVKALWTIKKFDVSFRFFDTDGTEITVTREDIEYGTAFSELTLPSEAEGFISTYYNGAEAAPENNTHHYNFKAWANEVTEITAEITFVAEYEEEVHEYYIDDANKAPTCTETGIKAEYCLCGYRYEKEIPANGHDWQEIGRQTFCTEEGTIDYKCKVCPATKQDAVDPTGHTFSGVTEKKEPTCTENGYEAYKTCSVCNLYFAENAEAFAEGNNTKTEIPAAGHSYGTWIAEIPATCEDAGTLGHYTCSVCKLDFDAEYNKLDSLVIPAKDHSYGEWIAEIPSDCENAGTLGHYHCDACGKNFDESKAELDSLVIPAKGHNYGVLIAEIPATCVATGTKAHYDCADCDKYFDENKNELSSLVIDIDPDNHDLVNVEAKVPTCEEDGYKAYEYCQREGCTHTTYEVDPKTDHAYEGKVTAEATCLTDGVMTYTCKNDSTHTYEEAIEAEGHKFTAATERIAPKCEETGMESYMTCSVCNKYFAADADAFSTEMYDNTDTFVIAATDHDYEGTVTAPTCEDKGYTTYICKNDPSHTYINDYVDATGHTPAAAVVENDKPATCLENGSYQEVVYCSVCTKELSRTNKIHVAPGHNEAVRQENIRNATCTTAGSYDNVTYCTVCNEVLKTESVTGVTLPHNYTEEVIDAEHLKSEATCTKYAVYYYDCADCTANAKAEDADTFEYEEGGFNASKHVGTTTTANEDIVAGTCNKEKTWNEVTRCDDCNEILTSVPKTGEKDENNHVGSTYTEKDNEVAGTCTSKATWETVTKCSDCDAELDRVAEEGSTDPLNHSTTETVLKGDYAATCKDKGYSGDLHCLDCDAIVTYGSVLDEDAENHAGGTEVRKENTVPGTCMTAETWNDVTYCLGCNAKLGSVAQTGAKNPENHTGNNTVTKTNEVAGTCAAEATWTEITTCECGTVVNTENMTGEKDLTNHTGETYTGKINENAGDCMHEATWTEVTYCKGCNAVLGSAQKTGEKNPDIHTGNNTIKAVNIVDGTCETEATWTELTICECGVTVKTEDKTGAKDLTNHTGETYTGTINGVSGNCMTVSSWTTVTYCAGCDKELSRVDETGEKNPAVHTGVTEIKAEDIVPGTCITAKTWNEVTYCECGVKLGTVAKTGEKDASNHEGTPTKLVDVKAPTCKEEGYTGNTLYTCCDALYKAGTSIPTSDHTPAEAVKENEIPATETKDGSYESVVYCSVCGHEISRTTVVTKVERTITFIMKDKTVEVKAYNGDTVALPDVADFTGADGFIYKFKSWDKPVAVVNGDATYTAVYNQPADWTALDNLEEILKEVLEEGVVEDSILEENKAQIEKVLGMIEDLNEERNTLDKDSQSRVDFVAGEVSGLIDVIYPDAGSTLVIEGSSVAYAGTILDLKAVKMPLGAVLTDAQWVSSDDNVVFFANGKLYAIGTGTVTLTATRGILKASKTVTIIEGGNTRGINFTSINNTHFIIEDYAAVYNSAIVYWSDDFDLRFRVRVYQSFMFDDYIVYINGVEVEPDAEGYYVVPAGSGDARVTIAGAMIDTGAGDGEIVTKWSFWEWLLNLFRKIADFFRNLFA